MSVEVLFRCDGPGCHSADEARVPPQWAHRIWELLPGGWARQDGKFYCWNCKEALRETDRR